MENIAFVGKMGTGKSYYSSLMKKELAIMGVNSNNVSISSKIKGIAEDLFGMKEKDRDLLQKIAGSMRTIDKDIWVKYLIKSIKENGLVPFIIDDLRFNSEVQLIRESFSMLVIKIEAEEEERMAKYVARYGKKPTEKELNDITETSMTGITPDITLKNDYAPETTAANISKIIKALNL